MLLVQKQVNVKLKKKKTAVANIKDITRFKREIISVICCM